VNTRLHRFLGAAALGGGLLFLWTGTAGAEPDVNVSEATIDVDDVLGAPEPTTDATLHSLLSTSPHAAQALRQTGLKDVGAAAYRRHQDRQLLSQGQATQGALFHELKGGTTGKSYGYTPAIDSMPEATNDAEFEAKFESMHRDIDRVEHGAGEMVWPQHMSHNQFGERPRTQGDIQASLGVERRHSKKAGFPER